MKLRFQSPKGQRIHKRGYYGATTFDDLWFQNGRWLKLEDTDKMTVCSSHTTLDLPIRSVRAFRRRLRQWAADCPGTEFLLENRYYGHEVVGRTPSAPTRARRGGKPKGCVASHPPFLSSARKLIGAERRRQVEVKGWSCAHDDGHSQGELLEAAIAYEMAARLIEQHGNVSQAEDKAALHWPALWSRHFLRVSPNPVRNWVKAGALLVAEAQRLQRAGADDEVVNACLSYLNEIESQLQERLDGAEQGGILPRKDKDSFRQNAR